MAINGQAEMAADTWAPGWSASDQLFAAEIDTIDGGARVLAEDFGGA